MSQIVGRSEYINARNAAIAEAYVAGRPLEEIAAMAEVTVNTLRVILHKQRAKRPKQFKKNAGVRTPERDAAICAAYLSGRSLEDVGQEFKVTRERIRQILARDGHEDRHQGFLTPRRVAARDRAAAREAERAAKRAHNEAERTRARELYDAGHTYQSISEQTGHNTSWVLNVIWSMGGPSRNRNVGKPRYRLPPEVKARIAALYGQGIAPDIIAERFDINRQVVGQIANKLGVYRKPQCHPQKEAAE